VYNTSKYAVVGLSETLQKDLRPHNIGVSVLCPMGVSTNIRTSERNRPVDLQNPSGPEANDWFQLIGRYLPPEDVAGRVLRAVKANRLYVITHEEAREPLRRRFERMDRAFEESS
jgi:NAD(P)-dependent dehydrogenase (short-subunit alcohol dehydrogenase family)